MYRVCGCVCVCACVCAYLHVCVCACVHVLEMWQHRYIVESRGLADCAGQIADIEINDVSALQRTSSWLFQKRQVDLLDETAAAQKAAKTLQVAVAELESDIAGGPCACFSLSTCCTLGGGYMLKGEVRMVHSERNTHESSGGFLLMLLLLSDRSGSSATERSGLDGNM